MIKILMVSYPAGRFIKVHWGARKYAVSPLKRIWKEESSRLSLNLKVLNTRLSLEEWGYRRLLNCRN